MAGLAITSQLGRMVVVAASSSSVQLFVFVLAVSDYVDFFLVPLLRIWHSAPSLTTTAEPVTLRHYREQ